eukprot:1561518-Amphidinium_carterae.1
MRNFRGVRASTCVSRAFRILRLGCFISVGLLLFKRRVRGNISRDVDISERVIAQEFGLWISGHVDCYPEVLPVRPTVSGMDHLQAAQDSACKTVVLKILTYEAGRSGKVDC